MTGLEQDASSVTVTLDDSRTLTTPYVVGADGAGSAVRKAAGIDFPGTDATTFGYVGEVALAEPPVVSAQNDSGAFIAVPLGGGRYRIAGLDRVNQRPDDPFTLEDLRATTLRVAGRDFGMHTPGWLSRFGNATRVAATYRSGRVLLAGDAAHMHFPAGGVGLNVGLQDAVNLGWKLAAEVHGTAAPGLLDSYHDERHPVGLALAEHTLAQTALIGAVTPEQRALRTLLNDVVGDVPEFATALAEKLAALDVAYPAAGAHPLAGRRVHSMSLPTGRPVLLNPSGTPMPRASDLAARLGFDTAVTGLPGVGAAVIRPDGHVWWAAEDSPTLEAEVLAGLTGLGTTFPT